MYIMYKDSIQLIKALTFKSKKQFNLSKTFKPHLYNRHKHLIVKYYF